MSALLGHDIEPRQPITVKDIEQQSRVASDVLSAAEHGTAEKTRVFLSYSRADETTVIALAEELEESGEVEVFRDKEDILPAEEWRVRLEALIGEADTVVFCLSPDSAASEVCGWEIETAERLAKRIVPVLLRPVAQGVPERIARLNYILLTEGVDRAAAIGQLKAALDADIGWLREHTRLGGLAQRWEAQRRRTADLLRGAAGVDRGVPEARLRQDLGYPQGQRMRP